MTPARIAIGLATAVVLFVVAVLAIDVARKDVIADGVRIGTVDVGGLERDEARAGAAQARGERRQACRRDLRQAALRAPEFRSWWACGWVLSDRNPLWALGFRGL